MRCQHGGTEHEWQRPNCPIKPVMTYDLADAVEEETPVVAFLLAAGGAGVAARQHTRWG